MRKPDLGYAAVMDSSETVAIVIGVVLVIGAVAAFLLAKRHPENASGHGREDGRGEDMTGRGTSPGPVRERPAGPAAEGQAVPERGVVDTGHPGPSTGQPPR